MTDQLETGDTLFCYRDTALSEGIRAMTQSKFSHTAVIRWQGNKCMVYDSQADGFTGKQFDKWMEKYNYSFVVMGAPNNDATFIKKVKENIDTINGVKYDYISLLIRKPFNIFRQIANVFRKNDKPEIKQLDAMKRLYCSEACAFVVGLPNIDVTPSELFTELSLIGWKVKK